MSVEKGNEQAKQGREHGYNVRSCKAELPSVELAGKTQDVAIKLDKTGVSKVVLPSVTSRAQDSLHLQSPRFGRTARIGQSSLLSVSDESEELQSSTSQPAVDTTPVSSERQQISGNASVKKEEKETSDLMRVLSEHLDSVFHRLRVALN